MGKAVGVVIETPRKPCDFCHEITNDEVAYGPVYEISSLTCHYFCILLSTRLIQHGKDNEGILGFLFKDIQADLKNSKKSKCCYCNKTEATINCCYKSCQLKFHLPCGMRNGAMFLFYKTFQSYCIKHRKKQLIPKNILANQKFLRVDLERLPSILNSDTIERIKNKTCIMKKRPDFSNDVCYICYENVVFDVPCDIFWPSCCKATAWFHRRCLSKMALSAGLHFIRCPLCNNTSAFKEALLRFGIFIPQRDASWESENGAFSELLERPNECMAEKCDCPNGRTYQLDRWDMLYCKLCGSEAIHRRCVDYSANHLCKSCEKFTSSTVEDDDSKKNESEIVSIDNKVDIHMDECSNCDISTNDCNSEQALTSNCSNNENNISMESEEFKFDDDNDVKIKQEPDCKSDDVYDLKEVDPYKSCPIKYDILNKEKCDVIESVPLKCDVGKNLGLLSNNDDTNKGTILGYFPTLKEETKSKLNKVVKRKIKVNKYHSYENYSILKYLERLEDKYKEMSSTSSKFYVIKKKVKKLVRKNDTDGICSIKKYLVPIENRVEQNFRRVIKKRLKKVRRKMEYIVTEETAYRNN